MTGPLAVQRLGEIQPSEAVRVGSGGGVPLWRGMLHALVGEGESGKTWLAAHAAHVAASHGVGVLVIDGEMSGPSWKRRMTAIGDLGESLSLVAYAEMTDKASDPDAVVETCNRLAADGWPAIELIVWDSALSLLSRTARSENDNAEVSRVYDRLREIVRRTDAAGLIVDHVTRGSGTLISRGATAKFNALDVSYGIRLAEGITPSRETPWSSIISVEKDRHGLLAARTDREATFVPLGHGQLEVDVVILENSSHRLSGADPVSSMVTRIAQLAPAPTSANEAARRITGTRTTVLAAFKVWNGSLNGSGGSSTYGANHRTTGSEPVRTAEPPSTLLPIDSDRP